MSDRPRIFWQQLDAVDGEVMYTLGWLPDSTALRWSLSSAVRLEGLRDGWSTAMEAAESAHLWQGYVGIDENGDSCEVTKDGQTVDGYWADNTIAATLARLGQF